MQLTSEAARAWGTRSTTYTIRLQLAHREIEQLRLQLRRLVSFERGPARRFDLVIGADGLHSTTRRLAFGSDREFVCHLGIYVATTPLGEPPEQPL